MKTHSIQEWSGLVRAIALTDKGLDPAETARLIPRLRFVADRLEKAAASTNQFDGMRNLSDPALYVLADQPGSIIDSFLPYAALAPFNTPAILGAAGVAGVVRERDPLPALHGVQRHSLSPMKTGSIAVVEKAMLTSPSNEAESFVSKLVLQGAVGSSNKAAIETLLDGGSSLHTVTSSGVSGAAVLADMDQAVRGLDIHANSRLFLIVDAKTAARMALKADGDKVAFPNLATAGGELNAGIRVIAVDPEAMPDEDSGGTVALLVDAAGLLINPGEFFIGRSEDADVEMSDAPDGTGAIVSLFQADLVALRTVRTFGLDTHRSAVAVIDGVNW